MDFEPVSTNTAEHYLWGEECDGWFLHKGETLNVIQERMPPNTAEVLHFHRKSKQVFYVLRGELTIGNKSESVRIPVGHAVVIQPQTEHRASNQSNDDVEFLVISSPPSHGDRVNCE
jgi:mannose-6-phosphate isomerase-like protein (cupin superfamily)